MAAGSGRTTGRATTARVHSGTQQLTLALLQPPDIRTWHANVEQHASEGVNKILIGNKCDWTDKKVRPSLACFLSKGTLS